MSSTRRLVLAVAFVVSCPIALLADTMIMRDGTRIRGELIAVRNGMIEFEEHRGFGSPRMIRVGRGEVARIEFDATTSDDRPFSGGGRPAGTRERVVNVAADTQWNDTGIDVRQGQTIHFEATGTVTWGPGRRHGPAGERGSPENPGRPLPNRPAAALVGKIGDGDDVFFIGDASGPVRVRNGGRLYLGVNDDVLNDNRGSFRVVVYY